MTGHRLASLIAAALLATAGSALARDPPAVGASPTVASPAGPTVSPLTVTPPKAMTPKEADQLASTFARALSEPSRLGQISRWIDRPCAKVLGLPDAFDAFVAQRIDAVADEAGVPKASGPCKANNVLVVFTTEPQKLMDFVARRRTELLGFHYAAQRKRLATFKGPVQAWYVTATMADDNTPYIDDPFQQMPGGSPGSRLSASLKSAFEAVLVVVDSNRIADLPIGRVADEVALRALARPRTLDACEAVPSILDSLKANCPASAELETLTGADKAYLQGLYTADPRQFFNLQKSEIASHVSRELKGRTGSRIESH